MRKITVVSTQTDAVFDIESSAETWGELARESRIGGANGMKAMVRETRNTLESPEAILPQGDFTLYLSPSKVKSGWSKQDAEDIDELIEFLEDAEASKHLIRFVERLKSDTPSDAPGIDVYPDSEFPVRGSSNNMKNSRNEELLRDAKRHM